MHKYIDIDPVIIEEEKKKKYIDNRPQLELPLPYYCPVEETGSKPQQDELENERGVIIIDLL